MGEFNPELNVQDDFDYQDDNIDTFFREPLTDAEIITMRKLEIEGKTIYGID